MNKNTFKMLKEEPKTFFIEALKHKGLYGEPNRIAQYWMRRITHSPQSVETIQGSLMLLDMRDMGAPTELFLRGIREDQATKIMKRWCEPGLKVFEAGANIGYYALMECLEDCEVIAVEADPSTFKRLEFNIQLNNYKNIKAYNVAVGDKIGELVFDNRGASNWRRVSSSGKGIKIPMTTVDFLLQGEKIDLLRMDVEGYELHILKGAMNTLRSFHPKLFIEVHRDLIPYYGGSQTELFKLLQELNYKVSYCFVGGKEISPPSYKYPGTSCHMFLE